MEGNEPPERYARREDDGATDAPYPLLDVPVIDLTLLTSSSPTREELHKLQSALGSCGCFQAINHGLTSPFLDEVRTVVKQFFSLPIEERQKYSRLPDDLEGYANGSAFSEHQTGDWADWLYLTLKPEDKRRLKFWPNNPVNFREILHEYTMNLKMMNEVIFKAMARSLNLEECCFLNQCGERARMTAKFTLCPPCPRPDLILGLKPHADGSAITFLLQDEEVEGLQVMKDDQWFRVPIVPHAILVNVGDQLEIMSNGMFRSPVHRVVTNSEKARISLVVFCIPESDRYIEPVEDLISEERPRSYKKVKNYASIYLETYLQGRRPIEAVKIGF